VLRQVLEDVQAALPAAAHARIERSWAGYIDMSPDMLPTLDRLEHPAGLVIATGFSGHGFGLGPAAGEAVAELVLDGRAAIDLDAFRYRRFHDGSDLRPHTVV
jgi:glycine/D-amino acid oxidase-like deaminating enzyme